MRMSNGSIKTYASAVALAAISKHGKHPPGSQLRQWSSLIGIITAIVGNILISFALNVQRYAHIRIDREYQGRRPQSSKRSKTSPRTYGYGATQQEDAAEERALLNATAPGPGQQNNGRQAVPDDDRDDESRPLKSSFESEDTLFESNGDDDSDRRKSYLKSPYWWLGIILMIVGEAGNFLAYGFAPASIVSPLGVVALISNCVIAPFMLKERFRQRDFWGVLVAICGAVTVVLSAKQNETKMGPDDLLNAIKRWEFLTYVGITLVVIVALMVASPKYGMRTVLIDLGLVGLFGGYTAISTKGVASLLSDTLWRALTFPITYLLVLVLVVSALMQIRYINRALQHFDSTQVIPIQFVMFTLSVIIGSAVLYREFESTTADQVGKFIGGCLLTFFGVYMITSGRPRSNGDSEEDYSDDGDEGIHLIDEEGQYGATKPLLQEDSANGNAHLRPVTPDQSGPSTPRRGSVASSIPSIAVTPASESDPAGKSRWISSADQVVRSPETATPQTPQNSRPQADIDASTPFYTPSSVPARGPNFPVSAPPLNRGLSTPAAPETPTRAQRSASPPKLSISTRPLPTPHNLSRSAHGSISRLLPGLSPLIPPLSSSLSGIVADSLRRGEGSPHLLRRNRSSRKGSMKPTAGDDDLVSREQTRETEPDSSITSVVERDEDLSQKKGRLRAVSETLGGLMRKKGKEKGREDERDR